ncbi:Glutathione synthetase [Candidatus Profftia lariciata]|uniref:glutathione synthase n=1 Tax=Candidatus Profftia lariciata TaxID=1987921 RepID=UPI001D01FF4B|nr:glutathione synthase [Candidatus Profftia lariciata]UDG81512.1 Glutathione synthetase [Candidatus Profftia lariciata]
MIKFGIVMDPIYSINIKKDTSFAILLAAQRHNYELYYMEIKDLYMYLGESRAHIRLLHVKDDKKNWYNFYGEQDINLSELNVILMRKNPPLDAEFIYATYILEHAEYKGTLIINKPQSLRDCNEKLFTSHFSYFTTDTIVTSNAEHIYKFYKKHGNIIMKPLDGMGGRSIFHVKENDPNLSVIIETLTKYNKRFCMAQKFLPEIKYGDKRILIVDGNPVPYCLARIPKNGESRGNLAAGGRGEVRPLTLSDWTIACKVAPVLKEKGLLFVGLDIIGDRLTEINVTSPTCAREIEMAYPNISITDMLINAIQKRIL